MNFYKSNLFGVNVDENFLIAASNFLFCRIGLFPCKFLGLPIGANPRKRSTWVPVIDSVKHRLASWKGKNLSINGRVLLINSFCRFIFFSFFKCRNRVLKKSVSLQQKFLWACGKE